MLLFFTGPQLNVSLQNTCVSREVTMSCKILGRGREAKSILSSNPQPALLKKAQTHPSQVLSSSPGTGGKGTWEGWRAAGVLLCEPLGMGTPVGVSPFRSLRKHLSHHPANHVAVTKHKVCLTPPAPKRQLAGAAQCTQGCIPAPPHLERGRLLFQLLQGQVQNSCWFGPGVLPSP